MKLEDHLLYAHLDLIITDMKMPGRSGLEVLHTIRTSKPHIPVIILTGHGSIETAVEATRLGAAEYVSKPINTAEFVQAVNKHARAKKNLPKELRRLIPRARTRTVPICDILDGKLELENEIVSTDTVPEGFVEVRFENIIPGEKLPFSVYIQLMNKATGELFLRRICVKGTVYTGGLRNILFRRNLNSVFIEERDYREYIRFLVHLKSLPGFRGLRTLDDQRMVLYGKALEAVTDVLTKPVDQASIQAAVNFVDDLFRNMVKTPHLYEGMYKLFKQETSVFNHAANVCLLTVSFALHLNLMSATVKVLGLGALYHDLGIISVDKGIIDKPGFLDEAEWEIVKRHPEQGARIMEQGVMFPQPAIRIIREHHERIDGSGYPHGLRGKQIGNMTHFVRIVDKFESLTTDKPYRTALRPCDALRQIFMEEKSPAVRKLIQSFVQMLGK